MNQEYIFKKFVFEPNFPRPNECEQVEHESSLVDMLDLVCCSVCEKNYEMNDIYDVEKQICYICSTKQEEN